MEYVEPGRVRDPEETCESGGGGSDPSAIWSEAPVVPDERYAEGNRPRRGGGDGVSVNMMLGPGPSSVATRVMGTGLLENLGCDACLESDERSERIEEVLVLAVASGLSRCFEGDFRDPGLLFASAASGELFNDKERFDTGATGVLGG